MPYNYHNPQNVISPIKNVKNVVVLYDGGNTFGSYSIAKLRWNNSNVIGVRWNITENEAYHPQKKSGAIKCVGEPNSRGYPTWFILPLDLLANLINNKGITTKIKHAIEEIETEESKENS